MTKQEAFRLIGEIDGKYVEEAYRTVPPKKKTALPWKAVVSAAACLCLTAAVVYAVPKMMKPTAPPVPSPDGSIEREDEPAVWPEHTILRPGDEGYTDPGPEPWNLTAQEWSASMTARDYFKNSGSGDGGEVEMSSASLVMPPYAWAESWSEARDTFEAEGVLPPMPDYQDLSIQAEYNGDGSLYKVRFMWMRRSENGLEGYSDLTLTAAPREIHEISDVVSIQTDEYGSEIPEDVTATLRDGVLILARGTENGSKTMTWQTEDGWYQVGGSWNDRYEDVAALFEWFWENPLALSRFAEPRSMIFSDRGSYPDAFSEMIPDFSSLGYTAESELVNLGVRYGGETAPVWFGGVYTRGDVRIRWTVSVGADKDAWDACIGRPREVTEEGLYEAMAGENRVSLFFDLPAMATVSLEEGEVSAVWELIRSMTE